MMSELKQDYSKLNSTEFHVFTGAAPKITIRHLFGARGVPVCQVKFIVCFGSFAYLIFSVLCCNLVNQREGFMVKVCLYNC